MNIKCGLFDSLRRKELIKMNKRTIDWNLYKQYCLENNLKKSSFRNLEAYIKMI